MRMRFILGAALVAAAGNQDLPNLTRTSAPRFERGASGLSRRGPDRDTLQAIVADRVAKDQAVGLIVGWSENGQARFVAAGRRGGPGSAPPDSATEFEIGSISKVFTGTLLAEMVGSGEVALTDPLSRFLPATVTVPSRSGKVIRLVDLATVSSGLPRLPTMEPRDPSNPYADFGTEQLYRFLSSYRLPRDPGAAYEYSNLGMGLLGHALALRAARSYEDLVLERVLGPAGMRDTRIALTDDQRRRLAVPHDGDLDPASPWDFDVLAGAGGWRSTAADMVRFLDALLGAPNGRLGPAVTLATENRFPTGVPGLSVGLAWHILEREGHRIVWHNGQTGGFHSFVGFEPATGANVAVLSNTALDIDDIGYHVINPASPLRPIKAPRTAVAVGASVLEGYVGRFRLAPQFEIAVTRQGDRLYLQATGQPRFRIRPTTPTRFYLTQVEAEVEFVADSTGKATRLILHQGGRSSPGDRVP
jgi:serine-type D-Ala-D-Ala carboxypeptidase/endopeptidase